MVDCRECGYLFEETYYSRRYKQVLTGYYCSKRKVWIHLFVRECDKFFDKNNVPLTHFLKVSSV